MPVRLNPDEARALLSTNQEAKLKYWETCKFKLKNLNETKPYLAKLKKNIVKVLQEF